MRWKVLSLSLYSQQKVSGGLPRQTLATRNTCTAHRFKDYKSGYETPSNYQPTYLRVMNNSYNLHFLKSSSDLNVYVSKVSTEKGTAGSQTEQLHLNVILIVIYALMWPLHLLIIPCIPSSIRIWTSLKFPYIFPSIVLPTPLSFHIPPFAHTLFPSTMCVFLQRGGSDQVPVG